MNLTERKRPVYDILLGRNIDPRKELVNSAYNILLGRDPDPEGASFWHNKLQNGMSRDQFLNYITISEEFQNNKQDG